MRNKSVGVMVANTSSIVKDVTKSIMVMLMNEKRFEVIFYGDVINCVKDETGKEYNLHETIDILMKQQDTINKQQDQISYWKHKINSLLWILSQFDEEKVKELLKELED